MGHSMSKSSGDFHGPPPILFEIRHTCRNCLENNIRQIFFYLGQARSEIWPCEKVTFF